MTLRSYIIIMTVLTLVCWGAWIFILFTIDPQVTSLVGLLLFYSSLFLSLVGTSALIGFLVRFVAIRQELVWRHVKEAFRQSFLFALLVVISLVLLSKGLFTWLNLVILVVVLSILEFFMLGTEFKSQRAKVKNQDNRDNS